MTFNRRRFARALAILTLACGGSVASGCALFTTVGGPADGFVPYAPRPVEGTDLFDWKGVIHCHSFLSHDSKGTIPEIARAAEAVGLDFLVMTDHQTPHSVSRGTRGMVGRTLFVVGAEMRTAGGTLLAFPLRHYVRPRPTITEVIADIHRQGGLAFIGHAERFEAFDEPGLDGIEILNLHAAATAAPKGAVLARALFTSFRTFFAAMLDRDDAVFAAFDRQLARRGRFPPIGGNDAHQNVDLLISTMGTYEELFRVLTTHVLMPELTQDALVEGLRRGRCYVVFDLFRDGTGFDFRAVAGGRVHMLGDEVEAASDLVLHVRTPADARIDLIANGNVVATSTGRSLTLRAPPPGVYRVEAWLDGERPWIFSSSIAVVAARTSSR